MQILNNIPRLIAFYLPQFYPFKENDEWWGKGFTEWTNVGKAKPLFKGHYQPRVPADLGYYDLRLPEVRSAQVDMAKEAGIEGFCYWHYWFGNGKRILERVFNEVLISKSPIYPFCLGWANESWSGIWHGLGNKVLIQQKYPGKEDIIKHFYEILPALLDSRYIKVDDKPLFLIYKPKLFPHFSIMKEVWNELAIKNGMKGIYFVAQSYWPNEYDMLISKGYSGVNLVRLFEVENQKVSFFESFLNVFNKSRLIKAFKYKDAIEFFSGDEYFKPYCFPTIIPNWDNSPRSGKHGFILKDSTPEMFKVHFKKVLLTIKHKPPQEQLIFVKSWNEWGEGNYLEPDLRFGKGYIRVMHEVLKDYNIDSTM